jgi:hypothetical protein
LKIFHLLKKIVFSHKKFHLLLKNISSAYKKISSTLKIFSSLHLENDSSHLKKVSFPVLNLSISCDVAFSSAASISPASSIDIPGLSSANSSNTSTAKGIGDRSRPGSGGVGEGCRLGSGGVGESSRPRSGSGGVSESSRPRSENLSCIVSFPFKEQFKI